jgi:hypothetical protein
MITFADRLWLAWKILRGRLVSFKADSQSFRVTLDFTGSERADLAQRLRRSGTEDQRLDGRG